MAQWDSSHPQNVKDLEKRTRSYKSSMTFLVCTPETETDNIWTSFLKSSQGYFTLRCRHCGELSMRSCDLHNLQFESEYNEGLRTYLVKKGTERLVCPLCHHEHVESDKAWMIQNGEYVHKIPELVKDRPGFQAGALASQLDALSWSEIANAQLEAGKTADVSIQANFDSSWRGLPFKPRKISKDELERFREKHTWTSAPSLETVEMIFISADTMDEHIDVGVFAWDVNDNLFLIHSCQCHDFILSDDERLEQNLMRKQQNMPQVQTVEDLLNVDWLKNADGVGIKTTLAVVDAGGHRADDVKYFAKKHSNVVMYKGTSLTMVNHKPSDTQRQLMLVNQKHYKEQLIYTLYSQKNREEGYFFINPDTPEEVISQIIDVRPNPAAKFGDLPANWESKTGNDHYFDVCKQFLFIRDFALSSLGRHRYRFGQAKSILRRFEKAQKKLEQKQQNDTKNSFWQI